MGVDELKMVWPVIDSSQTRAELMQEAVGLLRAEYVKFHVRPVSAPTFRFGLWKSRPALLAVVAVVPLPEEVPNG
jgi:hypothetical protein